MKLISHVQPVIYRSLNYDITIIEQTRWNDQLNVILALAINDRHTQGLI